MGLDLTPTTVSRTIRGKRGSVQEFVANAEMEVFWKGRKLADGEIYKMSIFDYITGQTDRHRTNYMRLKRNGNLVLIDNGSSFPTLYEGNLGLEEFRNFTVSKVELAKRKTMLDDSISSETRRKMIEGIEKLKPQIVDLAKKYNLNDDEISTLLLRIDKVENAIEKNTVQKMFEEANIISEIQQDPFPL